MEGKKNNLLLGKLCSKIVEGSNLEANDTFVCTSNILRVAAIEDSFIKSNKFEEDSVGIYIPGGIIEYFEVDINDIITCLDGSINVSSCF